MNRSMLPALAVSAFATTVSAQPLYEMIVDPASTVVDINISGSGTISVPFSINIFNPAFDFAGDPIGGGPANSIYLGVNWTLTNTDTGMSIGNNNIILGNDPVTDPFGPSGYSGPGLTFLNGQGYTISGSGSIDLADFGRTSADLNLGVYSASGPTAGAMGGGTLIIRQVPTPATGALLAGGVLMASRRRR